MTPSPKLTKSLDNAADTDAAMLSAVARQLAKLSSTPLAPALYIVATPIGHLADMSVRAIHTLAHADVVLCEDTRHSRTLLYAYGLRRKLETYHDFSNKDDRHRVLDTLLGGKSVALISDAGTPLIADPGYKLVREAIAAGVPVFAIPGASSIITSLVSSGLETDQFHFAGFLPAKDAARLRAMESIRSMPGTIIFFETAPRLVRALEAVAEVFPHRTVVVARELTKLHEEKLIGTAHDLLTRIGDNPLKGEIVLLIGSGSEAPASELDARVALKQALQSKSVKEAVDEVAKGLGMPRKLVYNLALKLRGQK